MTQYKVKAKTGYYTKFSNVDKRPNKIAKGFTKHYERNEFLGNPRNITDARPHDIGRLIVHGTFDELLNRPAWLMFKSIQKEHPADKGYFKKVLILSDNGKRRLRILKALKNK